MNGEVNREKPSDKLLGEVLANRYHIESKIGEGAMGAVYRARHVKVGRAFAVKVLHPRLLEDNKVQQRFEREAELAGRLRHPNVIGVVDVGETSDGLRYMVMDFAEGSDLATLLTQAPMPPARVVRLTRQLLEGLFHAHEQGLIHRDFKPENVIVERDSHGHEVPRIVDFGIAILREGGDSAASPGRLTTNGLVLGTPHYMAPEQAVADPIDHRIDLFALGIMVYEMLCGKLPFDGTGAEVARANLLLDPPPISQRAPFIAVDPLLEAFARRLMAKKRDHRPSTAKAARDVLDLIDRDRDAAAAALGVPLAAAREHMTTQPNAPVRPHTGNETFPPPIRGDSGTSRAGAIASASDEQRLSTQQTATRKARVPLIIAAIAGIGVLGGAGVVLFHGDDTPVAKVAEIAEVAPDTTKLAPPAPPTPPTSVTVPDIAEPKVVAAPAEATIDAGATTPATPDPSKTSTKPTKTSKLKPPVNATTKTGTTNPATTNVTPPAEPKVVDSAALVKQYQSVGSQLKALQDAKGQDATGDLWQRYRMINIVNAMKTQPQRDDASSVLTNLATEIAKRKK